MGVGKPRIVAQLVPIALLAGSGIVLADAGDVFNLSLSQTLTYDSNLFRLSPQADVRAVTGSAERSDTISRTSLRLTADKPVGRQALHAALGVAHLRYARFGQLDNDLNDCGMNWDWVLGHIWSGLVSIGRVQSAPGYSDLRAPVLDRITTDTATARAVLKFHPDWRMSFGMASTRATHSAAVNAINDSRVDSADAALRYVPGTGKEFGVRLRQAEGAYPNRQLVNGVAVDNGYVEDGLDADAVWQAGGASSLRATLGRTQRRHKDVGGRNFSGTTGRVSWDWLPTGKTTLGIVARREVGAQDDLVSTYTVTDGLVLSAGWRPTAKLTFSASVEARRRDQQGDPIAAILGQPARQDDDLILKVGAGYTPLRDLRFNLALQNDRRDSNTAGYSYRASQVSLSAVFAF